MVEWTYVSMRVHDDVRADAKVAEWHVLLVDNQTHDALLAVTTAELVANLRSSGLTHEHFNQEGVVVVARYHDLLDVGLDRVAVPEKPTSLDYPVSRTAAW